MSDNRTICSKKCIFTAENKNGYQENKQFLWANAFLKEWFYTIIIEKKTATGGKKFLLNTNLTYKGLHILEVG